MENEKGENHESKNLPLFLKAKMMAEDFEKIIPCVFSSKNRKSFVWKNPGKATFQEVVSLSDLSSIEVKELILKTGIGADTLTINQLGKLGISIA